MIDASPRNLGLYVRCIRKMIEDALAKACHSHAGSHALQDTSLRLLARFSPSPLRMPFPCAGS